jgi:hypothetical protein
LIDDSGPSVTGPITVAAMSGYILVRILERCGIKVEILGFTTRARGGGQARERRTAAGMPCTAPLVSTSSGRNWPALAAITLVFFAVSLARFRTTIASFQ